MNLKYICKYYLHTNPIFVILSLTTKITTKQCRTIIYPTYLQNSHPGRFKGIIRETCSKIAQETIIERYSASLLLPFFYTTGTGSYFFFYMRWGHLSSCNVTIVLSYYDYICILFIICLHSKITYFQTIWTIGHCVNWLLLDIIVTRNCYLKFLMTAAFLIWGELSHYRECRC